MLLAFPTSTRNEVVLSLIAAIGVLLFPCMYELEFSPLLGVCQYIKVRQNLQDVVLGSEAKSLILEQAQ